MIDFFKVGLRLAMGDSMTEADRRIIKGGTRWIDSVPAPAFNWGKLALVAAWGVAGLLVALRWFKWEPSRGGSTRGRRSRVAAVEQA